MYLATAQRSSCYHPSECNESSFQYSLQHALFDLLSVSTSTLPPLLQLQRNPDCQSCVLLSLLYNQSLIFSSSDFLSSSLSLCRFHFPRPSPLLPVPALPPLPGASIIPGLTNLIGAGLPAETHGLPAMPSPSSFSNPPFVSPHQPRYILPILTLAASLLPSSLPLSFPSFLIPPPPLPAVFPSPRCSAIHHSQQGPHTRGGGRLAPCEARVGGQGVQLSRPLLGSEKSSQNTDPSGTETSHLLPAILFIPLLI